MIHIQPASNPVEKQEVRPRVPFHRGMFRVVKFFRSHDSGPVLARLKMPEEAFAAFVRFTVKQKHQFDPRYESWWPDDGTVEVKITEQLLEQIPEDPWAVGRLVEIETKGQPVNKVVPINIGPIV